MTTSVSVQQWKVAQQEEQELWNSYAQTYSRYPQILLKHLSELRDVGEFISSDLDAESVKNTLEVGVGPLGIGVLGMQKSDFSITAVDPLPPMKLDIHDEPLHNYIHALRQGVTYQTIPGEDLPFEEEAFDFVCCHNVIDHTRDPVQLLEEIYRVLKPQCALFLTLHTFSLVGRLKFEILRRVQPGKMIFTCHPHSFLHADILHEVRRIGYKMLRHDGGSNPLFGRGRLSKFLCRK